MLSLRSYAHCIGLEPPFRVVRDFFGYETGPKWDLAPSGEAAGLPNTISLRTQMHRLDQPYFNLSVIKVGATFDSSDGYWDAAKAQEIDASIQLTREIYANAGFGVGRVRRFILPGVDRTVGANSEGLLGEIVDGILDRGDANNLVQGWEAQGDGIEVFVVENYSTGVGYAPYGEDGVVVQIQGAFFATGRTMAHEIGHFLIHEIDDHRGNKDPSNLMCQSSAVPQATNLSSLARTTGLDASQRYDIRTSDDWIKSSCFPPTDASGEPELPRVPSPWEEPLPIDPDSHKP